jgi:hypothetical protein
MFTIRNLGGVALFLFGTTFLWLTPSFASEGVSTTGLAWSLAQVLALVTLTGFTAASWGLFTKTGWWEYVALAACAAGLVTLIPYLIAADRAGETSPGFTAFVHVLGIAGVVLLLRVPRLENWVDGHVQAGR